MKKKIWTGLLMMLFLKSAYSQSIERYKSYLNFYTLVSGINVRPHWYKDGNRFWFAAGTPDSSVIYAVDPLRNTKTALFDNQRLRAALRQVLGHEPAGKGIPFTDFAFTADHSVQFKVEGKAYILNLDNFQIIADVPQQPSGQPTVSARDHNLWLGLTPLTHDGSQDYEWTMEDAAWSPGGNLLLVKKADERRVHHLPIIDYSTAIETASWVPYAKTGGALQITQLFVMDSKMKGQVKIDVGKDTAQYIFPLGWRPDGSEVLFMRLGRDGKKLELLAADPHTGSSRIILSEQRETFIGGLDFIMENWRKQCLVLKDGFIWTSERDGWKQLYWYDWSGRLIRRLTRMASPVVAVVKADEKSGWVYFTANAETDLYAINFYRVNFGGQHFQKLTAASGPHDIKFSPSGKYFLDTHSTPDSPPVTELRSSDGGLVRLINQADTSALNRTGFHAPESFIVKAADSSTDLYGILYKPYDFDPGKKYPVIELIYGGPFTNIVPHGFMPGNSLAIQAQALAQLGYITFLVDGRGTIGRSKGFQDAVYGNIGKYEIPDHVAALKQLAAGRPYMDLKRVGIYGHSWGGYFALRAMLAAPDVYKVGIASAPGELTEGAEINEPYMGLPRDNPSGYAFGNNTHLAGRLKGKLLFIHGTSDTNAPLSTTIRMIDALILAGKPYDLLLLPGQSHFFQGAYDQYANDAIKRYFEVNLRSLP